MSTYSTPVTRASTVFTFNMCSETVHLFAHVITVIRDTVTIMFLISSRYSGKVVAAVFIIIAIIVIVGLATMKNEYKECAGTCMSHVSLNTFLILTVY